MPFAHSLLWIMPRCAVEVSEASSVLRGFHRTVLARRRSWWEGSHHAARHSWQRCSGLHEGVRWDLGGLLHWRGVQQQVPLTSTALPSVFHGIVTFPRALPKLRELSTTFAVQPRRRGGGADRSPPSAACCCRPGGGCRLSLPARGWLSGRRGWRRSRRAGTTSPASARV